MALTFSEEQLRQLMNDYYGGYRTRQKPRYEMRGAGDGRAMTQTGYYDQLNTDYYKNNSNWRAIGDKLGININSINDISQLYDYFNENYLKGGSNKQEEVESAPAAPKELKPGEPGYNSEPTNNYNPGTGVYGTPEGQQVPQYDYSGYDSMAIANQVKKTGKVSTEFFNQFYNQDPEIAKQRFGHADLEGNLAAGISATDLLAYFNSNKQGTLNDDQKKGKGGIYDQVAALAEAEEPLDLEPLPGAGGPVAKMNIPPAMVGKAGNASGVRPKRSKGSRYGRNSGGTSQFNRRNFGNAAKSPLTIGGLNI